MSTVMPTPLAGRPATPTHFALGMWIAGALALLIPTCYDLSQGVWESEEQGHGPLILAVSLWVAWQRRHELWQAAVDARPATGGWVLLVFSLALYVVGRSQDIVFFEVLALIPAFAGAAAAAFGWRFVRVAAFPLLFLVFMVPLPSMVIDSVTASLKQAVSAIAADVLYAIGYPVARSGVVLMVGQYQLLVADACSGLNSMFSLSSLGVLYLYLTRHASRLRNALIIASILPIAFCANIVRVIILVLVTYHFGDEAGQGFIHGAAGMVLFVIALAMLFTFDGLLGLFFGRGRKKEARA
ncbi:MAG TPA: exosortase B [Burkholderiaceae bacterium]|nr:exosortase B [Burkholderiaceae bacterium]